MQKDGKVVLIDFGTAREFKESQAEDTLCWELAVTQRLSSIKGRDSPIFGQIFTVWALRFIIFLQGITLFVSPMKSILFDIGIQICHPVLNDYLKVYKEKSFLTAISPVRNYNRSFLIIINWI